MKKLATFSFILLVPVLATSILDAKPAKTGFAMTDLTRLKTGVFLSAGHHFTSKAEPQRLTFACLSCKDFTAIDVLLDKSSDGTEGRLRSAQTKVETIEQNCRTRDPNCSITGLKRRGAIGWVSKTKAIGSAISTTVLFKSGDRLVVRSVAADVDVAYDNGVAFLDRYERKIIG